MKTKRNPEKVSLWNRIVSIIVLQAVICTQLPAVPLPDSFKKEAFNKEVFSYHFDKADAEVTPEKWMERARMGLLSAKSAWEIFAFEFYDDEQSFADARRSVNEWAEAELSERYCEFLIEKFTGNEKSNMIRNEQKIRTANRDLVYYLDDDGNILRDAETGDPLIVRPLERDLEADAQSLDVQLEQSGEQSIINYKATLASMYPQLLSYINEENRSEAEEIFSSKAEAAVKILQRESAMIRDRERQIFRQKRTGDIWSLRKKSEKEAASEISAEIIRSTEAICNDGIASLQQRIENARAGTGDLAIAGEDWLKEYQEQFNRGLQAWQEAEERFFVRRIEWEQDAGKQFEDGQLAWSDALNTLNKERQLWEQKAKQLFDSGEQLFKDASQKLNTQIMQAKVEFESDAQFRITAGVERAEAWVNTYITSAGIVASARENVEFWGIDLKGENMPKFSDGNFETWLTNKISELQKRYDDNENRISDLQKQNSETIPNEIAGLHEQIASERAKTYQAYLDRIEADNEKHKNDNKYVKETPISKEDYAEEISRNIKNLESKITALQNKITENESKIKELIANRQSIKQKQNAASEIKEWNDLYKKYFQTAKDSRDALVKDFSLVMGSGGLSDILDENVSSEDFNLDEYQIELIRANAVSSYWQKRLEVAKAVDDYAKQFTADRDTETEDVHQMEVAKSAYDAAILEYQDACADLEIAGKDVAEAKVKLDTASKKLNEINNELNQLNSQYSILISVMQLNDADAILYEVANKYKELLSINGLLKKTGLESGSDDTAIYINYLLAMQKLGLADTVEKSSKRLKSLIAGDGVQTKSLSDLAQDIENIVIPEVEEELVNDFSFYNIKEDNMYFYIAQQILEKYFYGHSEVDGPQEEPKEDTEKAEAAEEINGAPEILPMVDYKNLFLEALKSAKEIAHNKYNERLAALRLLTASNIKEWLATEMDLEELPQDILDDIAKNGVKQYLEDSLASQDKIISDERESLRKNGTSDDLIFILLKDKIIENEKTKCLLAAYNNVAASSQAVIEESTQTAMQELKGVFEAYGIEYEGEGFPGMKSMGNIFDSYKEDWTQTYSSLIMSLEACIKKMPSWVGESWTQWQQSFMEYIASYSIYYGMQVSVDMESLEHGIIELQKEIETEMQKDPSADAPEDKYNQEYIDECIKALEYLYYQYLLINEIEKQKASVPIDEKHWREYTGENFLEKYNNLIAPSNETEDSDGNEDSDPYLTNADAVEKNKALVRYGYAGDPLEDIEVKAAVSYIQGVLIDKFEKAEYDKRKLNASFTLDTNAPPFFSQFKETVQKYLDNPAAAWEETDLYTTEFVYKNTVENELSKLNGIFYRAHSLELEIQNLSKNYVIASDNTETQKEMLRLSAEIEVQKKAYNSLLTDYEKQAADFKTIGTHYEGLYAITKTQYDNVEEKRFEYEKQDAIRRWAATSYLDYESAELNTYTEYKNPAGELSFAKERYERSLIVLQALKDLYNDGETRRPYQNEEYNKLYEDYKASFERMITTLKVKDRLEAEIRAEVKKNDELYAEYHNYLGEMSAGFNVVEDQTTHGDRYDLQDFITVDDKGRLVFNRNDTPYSMADQMREITGHAGNNAQTEEALSQIKLGDFSLTENTEAEYAELYEYFNPTEERNGNEQRDSSPYELAIRDLGIFLNEHITNYAQYYNWALARDYLVSQLQHSSKKTLQFSRDNKLSNGDLASLPINSFFSPIKNNLESNEEILAAQKAAWDKLSAEEKANLEFYTILTLKDGGGENADQFYGATNIHEYNRLINMVSPAQVAGAVMAASLGVEALAFLIPGAFLAAVPLTAIAGIVMLTIGGALMAVSITFAVQAAKLNDTKKELVAQKKGQEEFLAEAFFGTKESIDGMKNYFDKYQISCERLALLKGEKKGSDVVEWADIKMSLNTAGVFKAQEIETMRNYWEQMSDDTTSACKDVPEALALLLAWTREQREFTKNNLEAEYAKNEQERLQNKYELQAEITNYIDGNLDIEQLKEIIERSYGEKSPAIKNHIENIERVLMSNLDGVMSDGSMYTPEYSNLIYELLPIINTAYSARYNAELEARMAEWEQKIIDLNKKQQAWREAAGLILATGRADWKRSEELMHSRYNAWAKSFLDKYTFVSDEWDYSYELSMREKAEWVAEATEAANNVGSNVTLTMMGVDAEKRARIMDSRGGEYLSSASAIMESQSTLSDILKSSAIANMENAFAALNNLSSTLSTSVRKGLSGGNIWDAGLRQLEAVKMVTESNAQLAVREAKIVAANVRRTAEEAINSLKENINGANKNFSKQMDKTFLLEGRWTKSGNQYRKEVVVDSSVVQTKRESASVGVYKYYELEPIVFETDLSEEHLDGLESFAIEALIRKMQQEMTKKSEDVFGKYEKDKKVKDGKFDTHIGEMPKMVDEPDAKEAKSKMFDNYGKGELGRLMTEYQYWTVKEGAGFAALATPAYLQPLWCSESDWFKAPSLKDLLSIATTILTAGAGAAITIATTAITEVGFAVMEGARTGDWISAGLEFGKKLLTSAVSSLSGGSLKEFAGSVTKNIGNSLLKTLASGAITAGGNIVTGTITSAIGAVNFTNGKLGFDTDAFGNGVIGTLKNAAVSMTTTTVSGLLDNTIGKTAGMQDKITIKNANTLSSTIGGLAGQAVNYAMGEDFTLNLASFVKNKGADNEISTGLLELHLGKEGATMNLGTGGANVSMGTIASALQGFATWDINAKIVGSDVDKEYADAMRTIATGREVDKELFNDLVSGKANIERNAEGKFAAETKYNTDTGIKTITLGREAEADGKYSLGVLLSHEAYRNGIDDGVEGQRAETNNAVIGHIQTANALSEIYGASAISNVMLDEVNEFKTALASGDIGTIGNMLTSYDSSSDYWKLTSKGLEYDGDGWLKDEDGLYINKDGSHTKSLNTSTAVGAATVETGLFNILNIDQSSEAEKSRVRKMLVDAGITHSVGKPADWHYAGLKTVEVDGVKTDNFDLTKENDKKVIDESLLRQFGMGNLQQNMYPAGIVSNSLINLATAMGITTTADVQYGYPSYPMQAKLKAEATEKGEPYNPAPRQTEETWCNRVAYRITDALFGEDAAKKLVKPDGIGNTRANDMSDILKDTQTPITALQAQNLANMGFDVKVTWKNPSGESGHIATVAPSYGWVIPALGPAVVQGGRNVGLMSTRGGFGMNQTHNMKDLNYYAMSY